MNDGGRDISVEGDNNGLIVGGNATLKLTTEQAAAAMQQAVGHTLDEATSLLIAQLSAELNVTTTAVEGFFGILGRAHVPAHELGAHLAEIASRHKALLSELATIRSSDGIVQGLKTDARAAIEAGKYDRADTLLVQANERQQQQEREALEALATIQTERADTLSERAGLAMIDWRYRDAAALYQDAAETAPASATRERVRYWHKAGSAYDDAGDYRAAIAARETALRLNETHHPDNSVDLAATLNGLALSYHRMSRYADAGPLYQRSLVILEKALGADHPDVATLLNNLAGLYRAQGRYADAEPLYQRSLAILEKALGADHPDVAIALVNMAAGQMRNGLVLEAVAGLRRAVAIRRAKLGEEHPHTKIALGWLVAAEAAVAKGE